MKDITPKAVPFEAEVWVEDGCLKAGFETLGLDGGTPEWAWNACVVSVRRPVPALPTKNGAHLRNAGGNFRPLTLWGGAWRDPYGNEWRDSDVRAWLAAGHYVIAYEGGDE